MDSASGVWFVVIGLILLFLLAARIVAFFMHGAFSIKGSSLYVILSVFLSWWLPFSVVFLLPIDLASSTYRECEANCVKPTIYLPLDAQKTIWQVVYWSIFCVTWVFIPVLQSYVDGGEFSALSRLRETLRFRLIYLAVIVGLALVFFIYMAIAHIKIDVFAIKGFLMALSNAYGLLLLILFLGYGLIDIPRTIWHSANIKAKLQELEAHAPRVKEEYDASIPLLLEIQQKIMSINLNVPEQSPLRKQMDNLVQKCPSNMESQQKKTTTSRWFRSTSSTQTVTLDQLVDLNLSLKKSKLARDRLQYKWNSLVNEALFYQSILDKNNQRFQGTLSLKQKFVFAWYVWLRPWILRICAAFAAVFSAILVWCEVTINWDLSFFNLIPVKDFSFRQFAFLVSISYLAVCSFVPLMSLRVFSLYQLAPHNTNVSSLLFFAGFLTRLSFPLCWNVLLLSNSATPVFSSIMGSVNLVPLLGNHFNELFPITLGLLCLATLFNIPKKILNLMGLSTYIDDDDDFADRAEGRILLQEARLQSPQESSSLQTSSEYDALFVPLAKRHRPQRSIPKLDVPEEKNIESQFKSIVKTAKLNAKNLF